MPLEGYMRVAEAAAELGVSPRRVRQLIERGQIRAEAITRRLYLVENTSIDSYKVARRPRGRPKRTPRGDRPNAV